MGNDDAKRLILARRARFVAAALATVTTTSIGTASLEACGGGTEEIGEPDTGAPRPCLDVEGPRDGGPQPCLSPPAPRDAGPRPCLEPPVKEDSGTPQPCLSPPAPDAG